MSNELPDAFDVTFPVLSHGCQKTSPFKWGAMLSVPMKQNIFVCSGICNAFVLPAATRSSNFWACAPSRFRGSFFLLLGLLPCVGSDLKSFRSASAAGILSHSKCAHGMWQTRFSGCGAKASWQQTFSMVNSPSSQRRVILCLMFDHHVRLKGFLGLAAMKFDEKPAMLQGPLVPSPSL